ncbi:hypothetical protein D3C87_1936130 [compost metagenome]
MAGDVLVNVACQRGDIALVVHPHHDLRVIAVLPLAAVGQNKTHTPLADGRDGGDHARLAVDRFFNVAGDFLGLSNVGAVGQPQIDKENRRV